MSVNGQRYDWESIKVTMPQGQVVDIQAISYKDSLDVEHVHGKGSRPRGYGTGNYTASGEIEIDKEEMQILLVGLSVLSGGKGYMRHKPFPIVVEYKNDDQPMQVDVLKGVKLTEFDEARKQGDKSSTVKIPFIITKGINRNGQEAISG